MTPSVRHRAIEVYYYYYYYNLSNILLGLLHWKIHDGMIYTECDERRKCDQKDNTTQDMNSIESV